jgi:hypothetical protein
MIYWPPGLPDPQFGNTSTSAERRLQSEGDCAPRQRVVDPNHRHTLSLSWTMTEAEFRGFESWHFYRIHDGVSWFDVRWFDQDARARFTGTLSARLEGAQWQVTGEAEIDYARNALPYGH